VSNPNFSKNGYAIGYLLLIHRRDYTLLAYIAIYFILY